MSLRHVWARRNQHVVVHRSHGHSRSHSTGGGGGSNAEVVIKLILWVIGIIAGLVILSCCWEVAVFFAVLYVLSKVI